MSVRADLTYQDCSTVRDFKEATTLKQVKEISLVIVAL